MSEIEIDIDEKEYFAICDIFPDEIIPIASYWGGSLPHKTVQGNLPVIVSTDAKLKKDKYEHIGMKLVNTRTLGERSFMYDFVRDE